MGLSTGFRSKGPAHPGGFIRSEIVEAFGVSTDTLMRVQNSFNIAQARTWEISVLPFRGTQVAGETGPG